MNIRLLETYAGGNDLIKAIKVVSSACEGKKGYRPTLQCLHFKRVDDKHIIIEACDAVIASKTTVEVDNVALNSVIINAIELLDNLKLCKSKFLGNFAIDYDDESKKYTFYVQDKQFIIQDPNCSEYPNLDDVLKEDVNNDKSIKITRVKLEKLLKQMKDNDSEVIEFKAQFNQDTGECRRTMNYSLCDGKFIGVLAPVR